MFTIENINGVDLYTHQTTKFKELSMAVLFQTEIDERKATLRSMLAYLMVELNDDFDNKAQFKLHLEKLYGTHLSHVSYMHGKKHIMGIVLTSISGKLLNEKKLLDEQMKVLKQAVFAHEAFSEDQFLLAKNYIKSKFSDIYENKATYAGEKLAQIIIKDTHYHINALGSLEQLESVTLAELNAYYKELIQMDKIDVFVVGDVNEKKIAQFVKANFASNVISDNNVVDTSKKAIEFCELSEVQDVTQAKLSIGFRIDANILSENHYAANMFNGIFGGMSHSLLFKVVREKHSLCYSIRSTYDAYHGVVTVNLGVANANKDLALKLILEQLQAIQKGEFDSNLIETTFLQLEGALNKSLDSMQSLIMQAFHASTLNLPFDLALQIKRYKKVDKAAIVKVAKTVEIEGIFFLEGGENDGN